MAQSIGEASLKEGTAGCVSATRGTIMKISRSLPVLALLIARILIAQDAKVTTLTSKDLADCPGKEGLMITVVYPPGASDPIHRHDAQAFVYVLEGSIVMQVKGG